MSQPPDGRISIDNQASNQGAQGHIGAVTIHNHNAPPPPPDALRSSMLAKVRTIWIVGMLEKSLYGLVQLQSGLRSDPRKVDLPIRALVQEAGGPAEDLPDGTPVASAFDCFGGALLILGAPGAGKTTLLLELCRTLLDQAEVDPALPMPVIFPLSTWAAERKPLEQWLVDQLVTLYQVRRKTAAAWVAQDQVLPLLDGLDEVAEAHRPACVAAINAFRAERGMLPLVVCSRLHEYETVAQEAAQLRLHGAVIVQTLRRAAVLEALASLGAEAAGLSDFLVAHERDWLWSVATSPLGLSVLIPAVQHDPALLQAGGTESERRDRIFAAYVDAMFSRRGAGVRWSREETICLLSWLAAQMQQRGQTLFLLKQLQPDWLSQHWLGWVMRWGPMLGGGLGFGLLGGLIFAALGGLIFGQIGGLLGLVLGLLGGLSGGLLGLLPKEGEGPNKNTVVLVERLEWSWERVWKNTGAILSIELVILLISGLFGLVGGSSWLVGGLVIGLVIGLALGLLGGLKQQNIVISRRSHQEIDNSARNGFVIGRASGLVYGLVFGLAFGLFGGPAGGLIMALPSGLGFGLLFGLHYGGAAVIQHWTLRLLLALSGHAPLRYAAFLDHAAGRVLLRRVGGGWVFVHRLLLDYFASLAPGRGVMSEGDEKR
jgi:hypothetical protein